MGLYIGSTSLTGVNVEAIKDELKAYIDEQLSNEPVTVTFTIDSISYTADPNMTWGEWIDSKYNTIGIEKKFDTYVIYGSKMLLDSNDDCVLLTDIVEAKIFNTDSYYFTYTVDLSGCYDSNYTSLTGQYLNFIGLNGITWEQFINRKESLGMIYTNSHADGTVGYALIGILKGGYPAEATPPSEAYLTIDNGGSYSSSTTYWVP